MTPSTRASVPAMLHDVDTAGAEGGGSAPQRNSVYAALANEVETQREQLAERWVQRFWQLPLPRPISREDAIDSLREVLEQLAQRLREGTPAPESRSLLKTAEMAYTHGEQRFGLGIPVDLIVEEYLILRDELLQLVLEFQPSATPAEVLQVTDFVVLLLAKATQAHAACQERSAQEASALALRDSERKLRQLFQVMPFYAALARGPDHVMELVTEPLKALWGGRDPTGKPHHGAYPELGREHYAQWDRVYQSGQPFNAPSVRADVDRGDGQLEAMFFDLSLLPRLNQDGEVEGIATFAVDVTERRHHEESLRNRAAFEQQLVGIVSHDLRTPLSAVLFGTHTLLRRSDLPDAAVRTLLRVQSSAERAVRLVRDLLDFTQARLGSGIQVRREPCDLHDVCHRVVQELQMSFPTRSIEIQGEGDARGNWDSDRMAQVLGNLLSNALKYSPEGTPVTVTIKALSNSIELLVHNVGAPIPQEAHHRLFEAMERGTSGPDHSARSIGLGLYIVKHVVEAHHGQVSFTSTASEGTTFRVTVPKEASS